jgi:hypothetical protein
MYIYSADVKKSRSLNSPRPFWTCMACNGCAFPLPFCCIRAWQSLASVDITVCVDPADSIAAFESQKLIL